MVFLSIIKIALSLVISIHSGSSFLESITSMMAIITSLDCLALFNFQITSPSISLRPYLHPYLELPPPHHDGEIVFSSQAHQQNV